MAYMQMHAWPQQRARFINQLHSIKSVFLNLMCREAVAAEDNLKFLLCLEGGCRALCVSDCSHGKGCEVKLAFEYGLSKWVRKCGGCLVLSTDYQIGYQSVKLPCLEYE